MFGLNYRKDSTEETQDFSDALSHLSACLTRIEDALERKAASDRAFQAKIESVLARESASAPRTATRKARPAKVKKPVAFRKMTKVESDAIKALPVGGSWDATGLMLRTGVNFKDFYRRMALFTSSHNHANPSRRGKWTAKQQDGRVLVVRVA